MLQQLIEMAGIGYTNITLFTLRQRQEALFRGKVEFEQAVRENMPDIGFNAIAD